MLGDQVVAGHPGVGRVAGPPGVPDDVPDLFHVALAHVIEKPPGVPGQGSNGRSPRGDDDPWIEGPGISGQVPHAVETRRQPGQHQQVRPAQPGGILQRSAVVFAVDPHVAGRGRKSPRQHRRAHRLGNLVGVGSIPAAVVHKGVDDQHPLLYRHPPPTRGRERSRRADMRIHDKPPLKILNILLNIYPEP